MVCGLIFGEATALLTGSLIYRKKAGPWLNKKNILYLLVDIISAVVLIWSIPDLNFLPPELFLIVLILALGSHLLRTEEYLKKRRHKFCDNRALFIVNNIKLAGLTGILISLFI